MLHDHLRLMNVFAVAGEITGRKKLQKMIYIAKQLDFPFQEKFEFHFYGPYSTELTLRVEELCNFGFIQESKQEIGGYHQYRYSITELGKEFIDSFKQEYIHQKELFTYLNEQNARFLELVSTILYFAQDTKQAAIEKIKQLKSTQRYTDEEFEEAYRYIERLKKATTSVK